MPSHQRVVRDAPPPAPAGDEEEAREKKKPTLVNVR